MCPGARRRARARAAGGLPSRHLGDELGGRQAGGLRRGRGHLASSGEHQRSARGGGGRGGRRRGGGKGGTRAAAALLPEWAGVARRQRQRQRRRQQGRRLVGRSPRTAPRRAAGPQRARRRRSFVNKAAEPHRAPRHWCRRQRGGERGGPGRHAAVSVRQASTVHPRPPPPRQGWQVLTPPVTRGGGGGAR